MIPFSLSRLFVCLFVLNSENKIEQYFNNWYMQITFVSPVIVWSYEISVLLAAQ